MPVSNPFCKRFSRLVFVCERGVYFVAAHFDSELTSEQVVHSGPTLSAAVVKQLQSYRQHNAQ